MSDLKTAFSSLPVKSKRLLAVLIIGGGIAVGGKVRQLVKDAQKQQKLLTADVVTSGRTGARKQQKIAVNKQFFKRLTIILSICVPSIFSREALLVLIQGGLLVSRTVLTDFIAHVEGLCGASLISQKFNEFGSAILSFALLGVPTAIVNSGLKYMQKNIELAFQSRLTQYLHAQYTSNRAYYAASVLGGMANPDQRITEDVEKFCFAISELYSHTFKPLLDVIMFTHSLAKVMGYKGQFALYAYYLCISSILRSMSPPLAQMTATEAALNGSFRAAHQRLVAHSEEVAYNDPPAGGAEQLILNQHLQRLVQFSGLSAFQRFIQQIADGYFVKYFASCAALLVYAAPIYFKEASTRGSSGDIAGDYIRSMRLLQNTNRGIGDLILIYKRISNLASHTSRVSELLEQVASLSAEDAEHKELFRRNVSANHILGIVPSDSKEPPPAPKRIEGSIIAFHRVSMDSPDGTPLVRELTFDVQPGASVMLMGPNGCGKSSLLRVLAGLWPLPAGEVTAPDKSKLFYLSQRPYLVTGTLRDQLLYPFPPRNVWNSATERQRRHYVGTYVKKPPTPGSDLDDDLERCLRAVDLDYLLGRGQGWEQVQSWQETLSGGEKQRLAMARLLYHRPRYAILDECTSAVSSDGECKLYKACQDAGITFLSVAHRPALKQFHSLIIHFDGNVTKTGRGYKMESTASPTNSAPDTPTMSKASA